MEQQEYKKKRCSEAKYERADSPKAGKYQAKQKTAITRANSRPL